MGITVTAPHDTFLLYKPEEVLHEPFKTDKYGALMGPTVPVWSPWMPHMTLSLHTEQSVTNFLSYGTA
jgi:hypothetical protein